MSVVKFSVNNPVLVNMIMILVFIVGIGTMQQIPKEEMPAVDFGSFIIIVTYPGVSPSEMEQLVLNKIEEEIADVDDIDIMQSTASEGRAVLMVEFLPDADIDKAWDDLNTELDKINDLPEDAQDPIVIKLNMREVNPICSIVLGGDFTGNGIREIAEDLRDKILDMDYISKADIYGTREREIWIEADLNKLDQYGLTLDDLASAIQMRNMNVPGGTIEFGKVEFIVRTVGEFESTHQIGELLVNMDSSGRGIRVKDVATVADTLEERTLISKLDMKQAVSIYVYKKADGNIITINQDIQKKIDEFKETVPGLRATMRNDGSIEVKNSISTLGNNALFGVALVFVLLLIFIGVRNALYASIGIPFSFLLTFIMMRYLDITMNSLSLFGLVLVLGMIVDDAIIVLENVYRHIEMGYPAREAAIIGTKEIMWPVIAAVTTTAAAFMPMVLMEGMMGKFMRVFPIVVSLALLASLFESLIILPSHIAEWDGLFRRKKKVGGDQPDEADQPRQKKQKNKVMRFLLRRYTRVLKAALKHRWVTLGLVLLSLVLMGMMLMSIQFEFFPKQKSKTIVLQLKTPVGTNLDTTDGVVTKVESYIMSMKEKADIEAIVTTVGMMEDNHRMEITTSNSELRIDLVERDDMQFTHEEIKNSIRGYLDELPGVYSYNFTEPNDGPPTGADIEIRVKGDNLDRLEYLSNVVQNELKKIPGVADIRDSFQPGKEEIIIEPYHDKLAMYGLSVAQIAGTVRTAIYGSDVSEYRGSGIDEFDIIVRAKEDQVEKLNHLENLKIRTMMGNLVALKDVADLRNETSLAQISHRDQKRIVTITGENSTYEVNGQMKKRTTSEVMGVLFGDKIRGTKGTLGNFADRFPGYEIETGGVAEEQAKSYTSLGKAFIVAILLIFTILAAQFRSYVQPFIVMLTIPFSFVGVVFGLFVTRLPFSLGTLVAVVALAGVVVNDSLVLVDFVNRERERGINRWQSLINAGRTRLRPIILTTVTTIFGVLPMVLSTSQSAQEWKPIAVSMIFGLGFATMLTLLVIPVFYSFVDSCFGCIGATRFKTHISFEQAMEEAMEKGWDEED